MSNTYTPEVFLWISACVCKKCVPVSVSIDPVPSVQLKIQYSSRCVCALLVLRVRVVGFAILVELV